MIYGVEDRGRRMHAKNQTQADPVFLCLPAMQRWIVKDFLQAGSVQLTGLDIDMPIFCQDPRLIQIVVCNVQGRTVK